ncbi:MAG: glycine cleavage system protein H [Planctomycetota bacterium]
MSELVFMMGNFQASFPSDRRYCTNHMWAQTRNELTRFGFTAYAVRLLRDVYFLDWSVDENSVLGRRQQIGSIESKKAESDLYAPLAGRLVRFNPALLEDPSTINVDQYGHGWLFEMQVHGDRSLSVREYVEHLESVWKITQRTLKGQLKE